jgi:hypothetical protein
LCAIRSDFKHAIAAHRQVVPTSRSNCFTFYPTWRLTGTAADSRFPI